MKGLLWQSPLGVFLLAIVPLSFLISSVHASYDETLLWEVACDESYYDFYATLYFCHKQVDPNNSDKDVFGYRTAAKSHRCDSPDELSPIIRMTAGQKYQLKLINLSTSQPVNIHTHGLHIPGVGNTDNVRRLAEPNEGILYYNWTIPADHMDGTYWYHSHAHGHSLKQKQGGATGMLLIKRDNVDDRPEWMKRERLLHILDTSNLPVIFTNVRANGQKQEVIQLERNAWHLLRMNFVGFPPISKEFEFSDHCEVRTAAYDGVWRDTVPNVKVQHVYKPFHANRVDFAIKCRASGDLYYTQVPWLFVIFRFIASLFGLSGFVFPPLVKFQVSGNADEGSPVYWTPPRPAYLQDLRGEAVAKDTYSVQVTTSLVNNVAYAGITDDPLETFEYGSLQQWKLINDPLLLHPIHLHLYHMQIVTKGGCGYIYEEGQWYDTIAPPSSGCIVRFRMMDVAGRAMLHCHVPLHAEQGAIGYVLVDYGPYMPDDDAADGEHADQLCAT